MKLNLYRITVKNYANYYVEAYNYTDAITNFENWMLKHEIDNIKAKGCDDELNSIIDMIVEITKLNVISYEIN